MLPTEAIGCCGAYCGSCRAYRDKTCKGCKLGYADGTRDLKKAKCKIKRCCVGKGYISCADCLAYDRCETIQRFHQHEGYKYGKYRKAIALIKAKGYDEYLKIAKKWTHAYGKFE
ncbi:MAG: DUF3795 domain-containing protein [Eubacteriales bacterium]